MRSILRGLHNAWYSLTGRCPVTDDDDPMLAMLRDHEREARKEAEASRQRQRQIANIVEAAYLGRRHD